MTDQLRVHQSQRVTWADHIHQARVGGVGEAVARAAVVQPQEDRMSVPQRDAGFGVGCCESGDLGCQGLVQGQDPASQQGPDPEGCCKGVVYAGGQVAMMMFFSR